MYILREEVDAVCSRAIIIAEGKVLADDKPAVLAAKGSGTLDDYFREVTTPKKEASK